MTDELKVIVVNESDTKSIISDIWTYGWLFGGFFINRYFLGDSLLLQLFIIISLIICFNYRADNKIKRMNLEEAIEYFTDQNRED